ncbi:MAG: HTH domain-containing protein [Bacteroidales bacterium]|nr:HTH domain-containing protein [Bacteroidales bacterium]
MTLHEAIEKLLQQTDRPMTTTEIANELNKNQWYQKKDGSAIDPFQIHGRTKNYSKMFNRNGSTVSLKEQPTN